MPTLTQLEYLLAVNEERHFGRAAEKCFISQPSLSAQIKKVEDELGIVIFDRSKKPIMVTLDGEQVLQQALVVMKEHKKLFSVASNVGDEIRGHLELGIIPTLAPYLLPLFIKKFSHRFPKVHLKIKEYETETLIKLLNQDTLDAALLVTPLGEEQIVERHLFFEPFFAYLPDNHKFLKKKTIDVKELKEERLWLLDEGHCFREQMLKVCSFGKGHRALHNIEFSSGSLETLVGLVKGGDGYTLLPELATLRLDKKEIKNNLIPFKKPMPSREVSIVHSRLFLKEKIIEALEETIIECLPKSLKSLKRGNVEIVSI